VGVINRPDSNSWQHCLILLQFSTYIWDFTFGGKPHDIFRTPNWRTLISKSVSKLHLQ